MRSRTSILLAICLSFVITGCVINGNTTLSLPIFYANKSVQPINEIDIKWNGHPLGTVSLYSGTSSAKSFTLRSKEDFYGEVSIVWKNAVGKRFEKRFIMTKEQFPPEDIGSMWKKSYVVFEFMQDGVEYYTHYSSNAKKRTQETSDIMKKIRSSIY